MWGDRKNKVRADSERNNAERLRSHFSELIQIFTWNTCDLLASTGARVFAGDDGCTRSGSSRDVSLGGISARHSLNTLACPRRPLICLDVLIVGYVPERGPYAYASWRKLFS